MGCKDGRCVGLTILPLHMSIVLKSWSLNLLEPPAPVQVYNGNGKHYFAFVLVILLGPLNKAHPVVNITITVLEDLTMCAVAHKRKHFGGSVASIFMAVPLLNLHNYLPNQTTHTPKDCHLTYSLHGAESFLRS